jgi:hypothetical protein
MTTIEPSAPGDVCHVTGCPRPPVETIVNEEDGTTVRIPVCEYHRDQEITAP